MNPIFSRLELLLERLYLRQVLFEEVALEVFRVQREYNPVYRKFMELTGTLHRPVNDLSQIPFLPVSFFKSHVVATGNWEPETLFLSSGTQGMKRSCHRVRSLDWYHRVSCRIFEDQFGPLNGSQILGLLPTYLENPQSSLIHMVRTFGEVSGRKPKFFGLDFDALGRELDTLVQDGIQPVLFGVTYALLRLARERRPDLSHCRIIETGGMKGLGEELSKAEILLILKDGLSQPVLSSEYGMTEMLSQAYATDPVYLCGYSLRVMSGEVEDPLAPSRVSGRGALNLIDLANFATCSFIASEDLGQVYDTRRFEVFGRLDQAEIRGCNLLFS